MLIKDMQSSKAFEKDLRSIKFSTFQSVSSKMGLKSIQKGLPGEVREHLEHSIFGGEGLPFSISCALHKQTTSNGYCQYLWPEQKTLLENCSPPSADRLNLVMTQNAILAIKWHSSQCLVQIFLYNQCSIFCPCHTLFLIDYSAWRINLIFLSTIHTQHQLVTKYHSNY